MQRADRAWAYQVPRVPCLREHLGQRVGVFGEVLQRHRAVLDEADRLAVALEAHHDVEAGLAHLPQALLRRVVGHLAPRCPAARGRPSARPARFELAAAARCLSSPANSTSRIASGMPISAASIAGRKAGLASARSIMVRSTSSTAVGPELDDVLRRVHRRVEGREVDHAQHLGARQLATACSVRLRV